MKYSLTFARNYYRRRATDMMTDTCTITKPMTWTDDLTTGVASAVTGTTIYTGPCRIWQSSPGSRNFIGDEKVVMTETYLTLPWNTSPLPDEDDFITINSSDDPYYQGKTVQIISMERGGNLRGSRKFLVRIISNPDKTW